MNNNKKIQLLMNYGILPSTLLQLSEGQINSMYKRLVEQTQPSVTKQSKQVDIYTIPSGVETEVPTKGGKGVVVSNKAGVTKVTPMETEMKEEMDFLKGKNKKEVKEKSVSKQQQKFMGLAYSVKKGDTPKSKVSNDIEKAAESMSDKELKKFAKTKHKNLPNKVGKKETKEGYSYTDMIGKAMTNNYLKNGVNKMNLGVDFNSDIKENIEKMVNKHITPKISKKDFLNFIFERSKDSDTKEAPTKPKPKTKPDTKPDTKPKPFDPFQPQPGPNPSPRAKGKKTETKENTETVPVKPKIKPGTKPSTKPDTKPKPFDPFQPQPGPNPSPRAKGKKGLPDWLTYSSIGLNLK